LIPSRKFKFNLVWKLDLTLPIYTNFEIEDYVSINVVRPIKNHQSFKKYNILKIVSKL